MKSEELKSLLNEEASALVVIDARGQKHKFNEKGIRSITKILKNGETLLENAGVADRVVGKAAALLLIYAKIKSLYTPLMSESAKKALEVSEVDFYYDKLVPRIKNMSGDGFCPMEEKALDINDAQKAYEIFVK